MRSRAQSRKLRKLKPNELGSVKIVYYQGQPGISLYATGRIVFVGTYLYGTDSVDSPQIEILQDSSLYGKFLAHFHKIFDSGESV